MFKQNRRERRRLGALARAKKKLAERARLRFVAVFGPGLLWRGTVVEKMADGIVSIQWDGEYHPWFYTPDELGDFVHPYEPEEETHDLDPHP